MSVQEIEDRVRQLPPEELRRFAAWWQEEGENLLNSQSAPESEAVRGELRHRRQEYRDHPERFERLDDDALGRMFRDIENEIP